MILHRIHHRKTYAHNWLGCELVYETQTHIFSVSLDDQNTIQHIHDRDKSTIKGQERKCYGECMSECYDRCAVLDFEFKLGDDMTKYMEAQNEDTSK